MTGSELLGGIKEDQAFLVENRRFLLLPLLLVISI
jgi:hypothetical protein